MYAYVYNGYLFCNDAKLVNRSDLYKRVLTKNSNSNGQKNPN